MHESNQPKDLTSNFIPDISNTSVSYYKDVVDCNDVVVEEININETNNDFKTQLHESNQTSNETESLSHVPVIGIEENNYLVTNAAVELCPDCKNITCPCHKKTLSTVKKCLSLTIGCIFILGLRAKNFFYMHFGPWVMLLIILNTFIPKKDYASVL